jgi:CheY-like chemotaxis protein
VERKSVLVVEPDLTRRDEIAEWLEAEGWDVLMCGGPKAPDYNCLGGRGERCPLAEASDTVVLDIQLDSDTVICGTPGWILLLYYVELGKKIVALTGEGDPVHPIDDDQVNVIPRTADRAMLIRAVTKASRTKGGTDGAHLAG